MNNTAITLPTKVVPLFKNSCVCRELILEKGLQVSVSEIIHGVIAEERKVELTENISIVPFYRSGRNNLVLVEIVKKSATTTDYISQILSEDFFVLDNDNQPMKSIIGVYTYGRDSSRFYVTVDF